MKTCLLYLCLMVFGSYCLIAQQPTKPLKNHEQAFNHLNSDSARFEYSYAMAKDFYSVSIDSGLHYSKKALQAAKMANNDEQQRMAYNSLGIFYNLKQDSANALSAYKNALQLARQLNNTKAQSTTLNNLAIIHADYGLNHKATQYYLQALEIKKQAGNSQSLALGYTNIGIFYADIGNYPLAIENLIKSIEVFKSLNNSKGQTANLNRMGIIYTTLGFYKQAQEVLEQGLELAIENNLLSAQAKIYNNLGNLFIEQENITLATYYYQQAGIAAIQAQSIQSKAVAYCNLGNIYTEKKLFDSALYYLTQSLELATQTQNGRDLTQTYSLINLAKLYLKKNQPQQSLNYAKQALAKAEKERPQKTVMLALDAARQAAASLGQYKKAYSFFEQENNLRQSIFEKDSLLKAGTMAMKMIWQKEQDSLKLASQKQQLIYENQKRQNNAKITIVLIVLASVLLLTMLIIRLYAIKARANNKLTQKNSLLNQYKLEMEQKHNQLLHVHDKLKEQNNEIEQLNNKLEVKVQERTERLSQRNELLEQYASYNSHVLRAPIARLMGLIMLLEHEKEPTERIRIEQSIYASSQELDAITKEMQEVLAKEYIEKRPEVNKPEKPCFVKQ